MIAVTAWFTTSDAASALREAARYTELGKAISLLHLTGVPNIVLWGTLLGVIHGFILAIKAVVFIWAGPAFFEFLYPVFVAASRISARVATDLRKAWSQVPIPLDTTNGGNQPTQDSNSGATNQDKTTSDTGTEKPTEDSEKPIDDSKPGETPASEEAAKPTDDSVKPDDSAKNDEPKRD